MSPALTFGRRAFAHVHHLAGEIGPRPAGSPAEAAAFRYVERCLRGWGYAPVSSPVAFAPAPALTWVYISGGLALALGGAFLADLPALALLPAVYIAALPDVAREVVRRRPRTASSQNQLAFTPTTVSNGAAPTLVLCAHVDSAPASAFQARWLVEVHQSLMFVALRAAWALAALVILGWLGIGWPATVLAAVGAAAGLVGGAWVVLETLAQVLRVGRYSPGAHDNASGVGVLLAVAEHLAAEPPARLRVGFLFTGAEETGLHGAEAAARQAWGPRTAVLSVDMVGAGATLRYITRDGALRVRATDERLNDVIAAACPEARGLAYPLRSGDFLPFLRHGVPAGALQTSGSREAETAYHTVHDTPDVVELEALDDTVQALLRIFTTAEARGYPEAR